jgi:hypothetical protein
MNVNITNVGAKLKLMHEGTQDYPIGITIGVDGWFIVEFRSNTMTMSFNTIEEAAKFILDFPLK